MDVFVTGASGWIGSAAVPRLIAAGHRLRGLARNQASADRLRSAGVAPVAGDLDDLDILAAEARRADAVLHLANKHDWSNPAESDRAERAAVQAIATALEGTDKRFLLAAGTALPVGHVLTENDPNPTSGPHAPRGGTERLAMDYADRGVHSVSLRFSPTVHGPGDHGFIAQLVRIARERGFAAFVGEGSNRWTAVHRLDAGSLIPLALTGAAAGSAVHAVAEEGVTTRSIAQAIAGALDIPARSIDPAEASEHFGWLGVLVGLDVPASSAITRETLGWQPVQPTLAEDLAAGVYG